MSGQPPPRLAPRPHTLRADDSFLPVRRVDVHVHHLPAALVEAYARRAEVPCLVRHEGERLVDMGGGIAYPLFPDLLDSARRLALMDGNGIDVSVPSVPPPGLDGLDPTDALVVARAANDELAELGGRLRPVAVLPLEAPAVAAEELERAVGLGLRGGLVFSNVRGARLDETRFQPVFEAAAALRVPLVLHPATPVGVDAATGYALPTTLGFLVETTVCALRLVLDGIFERHPELMLVVPHVGSVIPFILGRIDYEAALLPGAAGALGGRPSEHLRRLFVDSVCSWPPALRLALDVFGAEHVLFGSDEPYWRAGDAVDTVDTVQIAGLDADAAAAVWHRNADRLFRLADEYDSSTRPATKEAG
jgi:predicted TIM-barrel fold metal-dependent hydrolase